MTHGSLFSGGGGFDLAAEMMGWENMFHCEIADFPTKVLKHYWPNAVHYADITKTDFREWRGKINVLSGGFPCQPYSVAGKRKGKDDSRHLWPEMLRAIGEIRPRWIVGENVRGLVSWNGGMVFNEVLTDLENAGYQTLPVVLPASSVNAPHKRERIFFISYSNSSRSEKSKLQFPNILTRPSRPNEQTERVGCGPSHSNDNGNGNGNGHREVSETNGEVPQRHESAESCDSGTRDDAPDTQRNGGREDNGTREPGLAFQKGAFDYWQAFPTQSPICGGDDGLPRELDGITFSKWRNESIKLYGNAVVPPLILQIFKTIEDYELIYG